MARSWPHVAGVADTVGSQWEEPGWEPDPPSLPGCHLTGVQPAALQGTSGFCEWLLVPGTQGLSLPQTRWPAPPHTRFHTGARSGLTLGSSGPHPGGHRDYLSHAARSGYDTQMLLCSFLFHFAEPYGPNV